MERLLTSVLAVGDSDVAGCHQARAAVLHGWQILHACQSCHRREIGYTTRGAPKESPEYLWAHRPGQLFLNLVDSDDPAFILPEIIDEALRWLDERLPFVASNNGRFIVHCDKGESRAPSIAMLWLARQGFFGVATLDDAMDTMRQIFPTFAPRPGMLGFLESNWDRFVP